MLSNNIFLKLEIAYLDKAKKEKFIYVSIGDNKNCIEKYSLIRDFRRYCNPKTNKNIKLLKLYNLHFL
ncbi:MAG: hypothetical protein ACTSXL_05380 [Alphaproteobacteria bacterium]